MLYKTNLLIYSLSFILMFIITWISKVKSSNRLFDEKGIAAKSSGILIGLHVSGILILGLLPVLILQKPLTQLISGNGITTVAGSLFCVLFVLASFTGFSAGKKIIIKEVNMQILSLRFLTQYFIVRILFLCSYELFFRGMLLFDCIKWFGNFTAIAITTLLTVLIHLFTNKKEMWACIPFGIALSSLCIVVDGVWPAILLHVILSLTYEIPPVNHCLTQLKSNK